jgi:hypothetical protein
MFDVNVVMCDVRLFSNILGWIDDGIIGLMNCLLVFSWGGGSGEPADLPRELSFFSSALRSAFVLGLILVFKKDAMERCNAAINDMKQQQNGNTVEQPISVFLVLASHRLIHSRFIHSLPCSKKNLINRNQISSRVHFFYFPPIQKR